MTDMPIIEEQSFATVEKTVQQQKKFFNSGQTFSKEFRMKMLQTLAEIIRANELDICTALKQDLNKSETEAYMTEVGFLLEEIRFTIKRLNSWMKPVKVKTAKTHIGSKGYKVAEPYGVTLIIAPWNYPFQLQLAPLIGAIAAGNTAILKPSELAPHTSRLIAKLMKASFDSSYIAVLEGGIETTNHLLKQPFDYIFFTGSVPVGKIVMQAAAKQLIPVTLELGGKSPCIVDETANILLAAKRIAFGKWTNAGQTCIAPDYLYVHHSVRDRLIEEIENVVKDFYGLDASKNENYPKIINSKHFQRVKGYLSDGELLYGGQVDEEQLKIAPTLMRPKDRSVPVMTEEIFGPILPILEYEKVEEVIEFVTNRPKPLALYLFTMNNQTEKQILEKISFGGGCVNDTLMHIATPYLPFGGVGESGIGTYHGESSFVAFSHYKSILKQTNRFDLSIRYPNAKNSLKLMKKLMK